MEYSGRNVLRHGKTLTLGLDEDDYIIKLWVQAGYLHAKSKKGRIWRSTEVPIEFFDMVEITDTGTEVR